MLDLEWEMEKKKGGRRGRRVRGERWVKERWEKLLRVEASWREDQHQALVILSPDRFRMFAGMDYCSWLPYWGARCMSPLFFSRGRLRTAKEVIELAQSDINVKGQDRSQCHSLTPTLWLSVLSFWESDGCQSTRVL